MPWSGSEFLSRSSNQDTLTGPRGGGWIKQSPLYITCIGVSPLVPVISDVLFFQDVLFAVVVVNNQVVTYIKPKNHNLVPIGECIADYPTIICHALPSLVVASRN